MEAVRPNTWRHLTGLSRGGAYSAWIRGKNSLEARTPRCRQARVVLCVLACCALIGPYVASVPVALGCATGRTDSAADYHPWFDGRYKLGSWSRVDSSINEKNPTVTSSIENRTVAWVALTSIASGGSPNGSCNVAPGCIVQTGWLKELNGSRYVFYEGMTGGSANFFLTKAPGKALNTNTVYSTRMSSNGTQFCFWVNNVAQTCVVRRFSQTEAQVAGETHNRSSQMPGTVTGQETFATTTVNGGTAFVPNSVAVVSAGFFRQTTPLSTQFNIYDTCSP